MLRRSQPLSLCLCPMNINAPFDCCHDPFLIQFLLSSSRGALLNIIIDLYVMCFLMWKAKHDLHRNTLNLTCSRTVCKNKGRTSANNVLEVDLTLENDAVFINFQKLLFVCQIYNSMVAQVL